MSFLRKQQEEKMREAERARELQRELDQAMPGKPFSQP